MFPKLCSNYHINIVNRGAGVLNEPIVINSGCNFRASQVEGINLLLDFCPCEVSKRTKNQTVDECMSSSEQEVMESVGNSVECEIVENSSSGIQNQPQYEARNHELQEAIMIGKRLGVDFDEKDVINMQRMIENEAKEYDPLLHRNSFCSSSKEHHSFLICFFVSWVVSEGCGL